MLSFTISLDDVIMSAFLSGPETTTLPLVVLSRVRLGLDPEINALGTLFIGGVGLIVIGNGYVTMKREQRRARDLRIVAAAASASPATADAAPSGLRPAPFS